MASIRGFIEAQLENMSSRDKKLLTGMYVFFVVAALGMFTMTLVKLQRSVEADVRDAKMVLRTVQTQQDVHDEAKAKLTAQEARLKQHEKTALSAHVEALADELGIKEGLKDAQRGEQVTESGVITTKWKVSLQGRTYDEAIQFLLRLENSGYPLKIENVRFKKTKVKREIRVNLTIDLFTYKLAEA